MASILVTGGAGYVGAHCCVALIGAGHVPVIVENFSNASRRVVDRIERIAGVRPALVDADIRDGAAVAAAIVEHGVEAVVHFAALKSIADSIGRPLDYYANNVGGTLSLLEAMRRTRARTLVFSSSATVYGDPAGVPVGEDAARVAANPYGRSKLMVEDILEDVHAAGEGWRISRLRYFNPAGAHESGLIGEDPKGRPDNLVPYVAQVAAGRREYLSVFGGDYPTPDGTGVRDYVHVMDLAEGHVAALDHLSRNAGLFTFNLGTGSGHSVLELVAAFERASGRKVAYRLAPRRPGDAASSFADPSLAASVLGWRARRTLDDICRDAWRWQSGNPDGYDTAMRD